MHTPETLAEMAEVSSGGPRLRGKKKGGKERMGVQGIL